MTEHKYEQKQLQQPQIEATKSRDKIDSSALFPDQTQISSNFSVSSFPSKPPSESESGLGFGLNDAISMCGIFAFMVFISMSSNYSVFVEGYTNHPINGIIWISAFLLFFSSTYALSKTTVVILEHYRQIKFAQRLYSFFVSSVIYALDVKMAYIEKNKFDEVSFRGILNIKRHWTESEYEQVIYKYVESTGPVQQDFTQEVIQKFAKSATSMKQLNIDLQKFVQENRRIHDQEALAVAKDWFTATVDFIYAHPVAVAVTVVSAIFVVGGALYLFYNGSTPTPVAPSTPAQPVRVEDLDPAVMETLQASAASTADKIAKEEATRISIEIANKTTKAIDTAKEETEKLLEEIASASAKSINARAALTEKAAVEMAIAEAKTVAITETTKKLVSAKAGLTAELTETVVLETKKAVVDEVAATIAKKIAEGIEEFKANSPTAVTEETVRKLANEILSKTAENTAMEATIKTAEATAMRTTTAIIDSLSKDAKSSLAMVVNSGEFREKVTAQVMAEITRQNEDLKTALYSEVVSSVQAGLRQKIDSMPNFTRITVGQLQSYLAPLESNVANYTLGVKNFMTSSINYGNTLKKVQDLVEKHEKTIDGHSRMILQHERDLTALKPIIENYGKTLDNYKEGLAHVVKEADKQKGFLQLSVGRSESYLARLKTAFPRLFEDML